MRYALTSLLTLTLVFSIGCEEPLSFSGSSLAASTTSNPLPEIIPGYCDFNPQYQSGANFNRMIISDDFSYTAGRDDINARAAFLAQGWTGVKSNQTDPTRNPRGLLFTSEGRLVMESFADTFTNQTDFYLGLGSESSTNYENIPGRLRVEFDYQVDPASQFDRHDKFLYPGRRYYPQGFIRDPGGNIVLDAEGNQMMSYLWLLGTSTSSNETDGSTPVELGRGADLFMFLRPVHADFRMASEYPTNKDKLGPNLRTDIRLSPGCIHRVAIQIDTSTQSGRFEMWIDGYKTHEWIDGVTPNFSWRIPASMVGGHTIMRTPTTLSGGHSITYLDNFKLGSYE